MWVPMQLSFIHGDTTSLQQHLARKVYCKFSATAKLDSYPSISSDRGISVKNTHARRFQAGLTPFQFLTKLA